MVRQNLVPVWVGIVLLSGMFLLGQNTWPPCVDGDGDGYGAPGSQNCTYPEEDCDDTDAAVNPGAVEGPPGDPSCSDSIDNDCNGGMDLNDPRCGPLEVSSITPMYLGEQTRFVDVVQDDCAEPPDPPDPEPFDSHYADVTLQNWCLPQFCTTLEVASYEVWYQPVTQGAPELPPSGVIPIPEPVRIEPCEPGGECPGETVPQVDFVPLARKQLLHDFLMGNPPVLELRYNVFYRFFGENESGGGAGADGAINFYAADYDYCGY